jgi:hypothetical protein
MDISLRRHFSLFLSSALALSIALISLPVLASDQRPAPQRIRILKVSKIGENTPNIISGRSSQKSQEIPIPRQKPQISEPEHIKKPVQKETLAEESPKKASVMKALSMKASNTNIVKTTREISPLADAPQSQETKRSVTLATTPSYCSDNQQNDVEKAAMSGQPFTNTQKDNRLAQSLRAYMKAEKRAPATIDALLTAAQETGVSFELMAIKAMIESNLGTHTIAPQSSARGIFQYIDATWLSLIKRHGEKIGYASYTNALEYDPTAKHFTTSPNANISRKDILDLRDDAHASAMIKAYQIIGEQSVLKEYKEGNAPTITDHYIIHMLGQPLSRTFYRLKNSNSPIIPASLKNGMFNQAIALNPYFFYDDNKNALNASQIYERFAKTTARKIDELRAIDKRHGSGENVVAKSCTPTPLTPRIHTPSAKNFYNTAADSSLDNIEPAAKEEGFKDTTQPHQKKYKQISSIELLQHSPSPILSQNQEL